VTGWVEIGPLDLLPAGSGLRVESGEHRVALFRVDGAVYAIGDRCSHAEASLAEGDVFDAEVECPRHGATFDLTSGKALTLPASRPVPTYQTKVEDGTVFVRLEQS
jgi:3-phenylpropionate/trans-cinnamate dioxygenase ferredoxin subunit